VVERTSDATLEAGTVEEDAGVVDQAVVVTPSSSPRMPSRMPCFLNCQCRFFRRAALLTTVCTSASSMKCAP